VAPKVNAPPNQAASSRRRRWLATVIVLALAAFAGIGGALWQRHARVMRLRAALPALPAAMPNATLRALLETARIEASTTGELPAVAEFARLCHANGLSDEAGACWRLLVREQPDEARWHYHLADLLRAAGEDVAAEKELQLTVAADPSAAPAWLQLAEAKLKTGRPAAAEHDYRRRLELLPDDPYAELGLARIAQLQGRLDDTLARLERILKKHPQFSTAHNLYAELQAAAGREDLADLHRWRGREAGRFREADDPWTEELNARCHEPKRLCHLGVIAYQTRRGDLGRAQFERAIAVAPDDPLPYQLLGELLLEQGSAQTAAELLQKGLSLTGTVRPAPTHYLKLSDAWRTLNRPELAREALAEGLRRHSDSPELLHAQGNQLKADGRIAEAATAYRRTLELNPAFGEADFALAILLLESNRPDEAVQALDHALGMQPTFPKALLLRARLEMQGGRIENAGRYLLPLLKANPGAPEIRQITANWHLEAGWALEKNNPSAAEQHYRAGLTLAPDDPELNAELGVHLLITHRAEEAVPMLEIYRRAQPTNPQTALFLGQAYARTGRLADARRVLTAGMQQAEQTGQVESAKNFREILSVLPP
jgi:tetratricopeptide (TPR) repeat protein